MNEILDELNGADRAELEAEQAELRTATPAPVAPGIWAFGPYAIVKDIGGWTVPALFGDERFRTIAQAANAILESVFYGIDCSSLRRAS